MADALREPVSCRFAGTGLDLHYLDWGGETLPPLILLHGNRDHARSWDTIARALSDRFRVFAFDLRGHGDSDWSPDGAYLMPYHVADLVALVAHLGLDRFVLVAHSFGGGVASRYAGVYPDRVAKFVAIDGFGPSLEIQAQWAVQGPIARTRDWLAGHAQAAARPPRLLADLDEGIARMTKANPALKPDQARHLAVHGMRPATDGGFAWKYDPRVGTFAPEDFAIDIAHYWAGITAPTLLCFGADSWSAIADTDPRPAVIANLRLTAIPKAGHWPHHDQPEAFLALLGDFLA